MRNHSSIDKPLIGAVTPIAGADLIPLIASTAPESAINTVTTPILDAAPSEICSPPVVSEPSGAVAATANLTGAVPFSTIVKAEGQAPVLKTKAATWEDKEPIEPWCPAALGHVLPWAQEAAAEYRHNYTKEFRHAGWRLLAATRRGRLHGHNAQHREDAFAFESGEQFLIVAVSDGAGAYEWSRLGSAATAREITKRIQSWLSEEWGDLAKLDRVGLVNAVGLQMVRTVHAITDWFINDLAPKSGTEPKDFRCTLLLTVWCHTEKAEVLLTTQVGDGFFGILSRDGCASRHGTAESGSFSGEVTSFIPDTNAPERSQKAIKSHPVTDLEAMLICSDGVEDPFYPLERHSRVIFHELYKGLSGANINEAGVKHNSAVGSVLDDDGVHELAKWLQFEKKGENDDRTIVLLHRDPPRANIRIRPGIPAA